MAYVTEDSAFLQSPDQHFNIDDFY